jgi:hypothetical protein
MAFGATSSVDTEINGASFVEVQIGGSAAARVNAAELRPASAGGLDLGTNALPFGELHAQVLLGAGAEETDAPSGYDELVVGDGSANDFGVLVFTGNANTGAYGFTDVAGSVRAFMSYSHGGSPTMLWGYEGNTELALSSAGFFLPVTNLGLTLGGASNQWEFIHGETLVANGVEITGVSANPTFSASIGDVAIDDTDGTVWVNRDGSTGWRDISRERHYWYSQFGVAGLTAERFFPWYAQTEQSTINDSVIWRAMRDGRITAFKIYGNPSVSSVTITVRIYIQGVVQFTQAGINIAVSGDADAFELGGSAVALDGAAHDEVAVSVETTGGSGTTDDWQIALEYEYDPETGVGT